MLEQLNKKLIEQGHQTDYDKDGIYLPNYDIDIVQDENNFIIAPNSEPATVTPNVDEAVIHINDYVKANGLEHELEKNNYDFKKSDDMHFSIGENSIYIQDGKLYLKGMDGGLDVYLDVKQIIGALQSKFLGEK